jgi:cytochrome c-type biogenesis protein CcmH
MTMAWFWIFAGLMLATALALLLAPLLGRRSGRALAAKMTALRQAHATGVLSEAEYAAKLKALAAESDAPAQPAAPLPLVLGLAVALPLAAIALSSWKGNPRAIDAPSASPEAASVANSPHADGASAAGPEMEKAVAGLAEKLKQNPEDLQGWLLLGRAYKNMQRFAEAREALTTAYKLAPDNPEVMVDYAEALALASADHKIDGEARALIDKVFKADPTNQRALWLIGIAEAQAERYPQAVSAWESLLPMLPADSPIAGSVREQIAEARKRAGMPADPLAVAPPTGTSAPRAAAATGGASLTVTVDLAPELKSKVNPEDVLYIFARASEGPKMPLAIQRMTAADLPATVTLTDGMGMTPTMRLSSVEQVVVGARISKTGVATPTSGDLQVLSKPITTKAQTAPVLLTINEVVP